MASPNKHILLFPFPASGHVIPLLDLAQHLLARGLTLTVLLTPQTLPLLEPHPSLRTLVLSPPEACPVPGVPRIVPGIVPVIRALSELYEPIKKWFKSHPDPPIAIISDFFLGWTQNLAANLGVPRVVFWSSGAFSVAVTDYLWRELPRPDDPEDENYVLSLTGVPNCPKYPWWQISLLLRNFKKGDPNWEFVREGMLANVTSWGYLFNSFEKLEGVYLDHLKNEMGHDRVWAVGPLLPFDDDNRGILNRGGSSSVQTNEVIDWLDSKSDNQVVYICFGSKWTLNGDQVGVLASALESSGVHFIWVLKNDDLQYFSTNGFENRVKGRGILIKGWAPQVVILKHRTVGSFVTHCGWNSVLEGLSAGVLLLTWPLAADQFYNTKLLVDELGVGVRFCDGGDRILPEESDLARLLSESAGDLFSDVRDKVREMKIAAYEALEGGSSTRDIDTFVQQIQHLGN